MFHLSALTGLSPKTVSNLHFCTETTNFKKWKKQFLTSLRMKSPTSKRENAYKSASSRLIKKHYPQVKRKFWKEYFWSRGFCLLTTGGAPIEVIKQYRENQGRK
ncbi:transposase [Bacillus smithii]|uniref:transposase n=1 Tax=Bacillus smithii TaxID=1479 RepID=UPI002E1A374E|nr:transposase [Bacillus smithii]MED1455795.1 transposase [Bacillus smithii]